MSLQFTQNEIEKELRDCFPNGLIRAVSIESGIGESYLDRGINPNDEHPSFAYRFLQVQCALDTKNAYYGDRHWQTVTRFRELSLPPLEFASHIDFEVARSNKETADLVNAVLTDKPLDEQYFEAKQAFDQAKRCLDAISERLRMEKDSARFGGRPVSYKTRNAVNLKRSKANR